jgi:hypothetical protein
MVNQLLDLQRGWIDLHDVRCLRRRGPSLAGRKQRAVRGPSDIIDTKADRNLCRCRPREKNGRAFLAWVDKDGWRRSSGPS